VTVTLSNGTDVTLNEKNGRTATVNDFPKYDDEGKEIEYTWTEESVSGYKLASTKTSGTVTTITNTVIPDEPGKPSKPAKPTKLAKPRLPQTGDMASTAPVVLLGAGLACLALGKVAKRRRTL
jgi:LPXTG-motif cell wall-anchored protein